MRYARLTSGCLATLLLTSLGGCRCNREASVAVEPSQQDGSTLQQVDRRVADLRQMRRVEMYAGELQRRVKHGGEGARPALELVTKLVREVPPAHRGEAFALLQAQFVQRARALAESEPSEMKAGLGTLLDTCTACHRRFGPDFVHKAEALRLP